MGQQWFDDILGPAQTPEPNIKKPEPVQQANSKPKQKQLVKQMPKPYRAPITNPWKRLLRNVQELYPQYYKAFRIVQQQGVTIIQGQDRFYLGRGTFLSVKDFETLVSHLYYHIIEYRTQEAPICQVFKELRKRSVRLKEAGETGLRLMRSEYISEQDWEKIKQELLEPNRDEVIRVQRMARDELSSILSLSSMAEVVQHDSGLEWDQLAK